MQVNHKDGVKTNNAVRNLEYVTHSENTKHAYDIGIKVAAPSRGERNGGARLDEATVRKIYQLRKSGSSLARISSEFGIAQATVSKISRGKRWKHLKLLEE